MNPRKQEILQFVEKHADGLTAKQIADSLQIDRSNVSRYLNELAKNKSIQKSRGRPVVYYPLTTNLAEVESIKLDFERLVGADASLKVSIQQAKAAMLYPPRGLHTIIFGQTGTGKTMFAECMYQFAVQAKALAQDAPFISFNCADYAQNPQLLFGHIFGVKKGAYTGADANTKGLLAEADGGILFLDEIHRLPPEGQEMLFSFIDKGQYRPLGESSRAYEASVQIIGATTESSDAFLGTFNRRIPMSITLPDLAQRSLDERYEIITLFIKQEASRLNRAIKVEKDAIVAFMLYDAPANIGQIKRDVKIVCAKSFLHYRTHEQDELIIRKKDCPLQVQKGMLKIKERAERLDHFLEGKGDYLIFEAQDKEVSSAQDSDSNMEVYQEIEEKLASLNQLGVDNTDLEKVVSKDVEAYFANYVKELTQTSTQRGMIASNIWNLTNQLYDIAEKKLERSYNEKARFAFALHLQLTLDRIHKKEVIVHPDLNRVRKNLKSEFQLALDLSTTIEEELQVEIPFDEIGFISMFLSIQLGEHEQLPQNNVGVIVLMHGNSTASSILSAAQELLGTTSGVAMDMPLDTVVNQMYQKLLNDVIDNKSQFSNGLLLLTDMGSLNSFATLLYEETGIRTKAVSMTSTMIVIEALRMSEAGRSLEDIYQNIQSSFETIVREQFQDEHGDKDNKKAIVVTCFTGEGVAAKLYERIAAIVDQAKVEIIQMQFIEKETFKKHIDGLLEEYEIKAIAGTVEVEYQNIPFFSAYDVFDDQKLKVLKSIVKDEIAADTIVNSLDGTITHVGSLAVLVETLKSLVQQVQTQLHIILEPSVEAGLVIHLAFLIEALRTAGIQRQFPDLAVFQKKYRLETDILKTSFISIEKNYDIQIPDDEIAYLTEAFIKNQIDTPFKLYTQI
ncbi:sigma 54-interacting transcriptional regulator [Tetragenococcus halophilus]|uniref:DNA translocase FtsK n=1 Tax=Tetragenococcus halophilus (strain DSM 20338 / JCM 20259 / NCIMB 9735 / NBRC 12172) TaxID=945021 RepID=A0AAN1SHA1_TETHN|nr:sigma-54-dependent transcriptional regulator [Tetragenococcus halophilus]MCO7025659.1 sigma 54-interacting transcriptional regulator [Tetragenococcus halophilus]BAK95003.1 putative LevR family transcriptional regulator [Tetragenococcus halophilus NBRC 12172]GBD60678.1 putative LevR family transcriptional regulator [Tetragenococcus halophilus subsp. halophilus]GBD70936.1 putative LevR family transcriptional regulator [Tetragenococcus halophilus subsp. halophilus]GBD80922.1 putative LevR fami